MRSIVLVAGLFFLLAAEIARVYFIMPFPGSQQANTVGFAYWLGRNITWIRIFLLLLVAWPLLQTVRQGKRWQQFVLTVFLIFYGVVFYFFNFRFEADKMFYQPRHKDFAAANLSGADTVLVIGVEMNGEAKAFPIQIIGYHHQVRDTIGGTAVMVTYCTVCRTGRVYSPMVNGKNEDFRLVGMDHFNAMFEDATTKSWWQQATGVAIAGPLKGKALNEIPSQQMTLAAWQRIHPNSTVLLPDSSFKKQYKGLDNYNKGTIKGSLEKRDSASWKFKSWVVGVDIEHAAKAYDWNELVKKQLIEDSVAGTPLLIALEPDSASFHVWSRKVNALVLNFEKGNSPGVIIDINTHSTWNMNGLCVEGALKGSQLARIPAYQEFWHSWRQFHPGTLKY
ncbi:MAG: DUF3179 domain-containing protein [Bacteroidota bacterium]|nr:DUF3179 domain-containing protein [Bacteroidota bacterium]